MPRVAGERGVSGFGALQRRPVGKWAIWRFNWLAHRALIAAVERASVHAHGVLLDVGCGARPYAKLLGPRVTRYWGADIPGSRFLAGSRPDVYARGEALPVRGAAIDTVLGMAMLTYFPDPLVVVREAWRVLRPGGVLLMEFTQMAPLHDEPHDYFRFTRYGAQALLERAGFELVDTIPIGGLWSRVGLSTIAGLNRINRGPTRVLTELPVRALYVLLQAAFAGLDGVFGNRREVLAHLVVARRPSCS
jgi:SAM-dependent methyltransferase